MSSELHPPPRRRNLSIILIVLAVVVVGFVVARRAADLAHRAPRASGPRVAVLPLQVRDLGPDVDAKGLDVVIARVFEDALVHGQGVSVVPLDVVRGRAAVMRRAGQDASLENAAGMLEVDHVLTGTIEADGDDVLRVTVAAQKPGTVATPAQTLTFRIRGEDPMRDLLAAVPGVASRLTGWFPATPTPTMDITAFARDVRAREIMAEGKVADSVPLFLEGEAPTARAHAAVALALLRDPSPSDTQNLAATLAALAPVEAGLPVREKLLVTGIREMRSFADGNTAPDVSERAIAAFRALTVSFPEDPLGHLFLGRSYTELMHAPDEALRHLELARRLTPDWLPATEEIVAAWLAKGNRKQAVAELKSFTMLNPESGLAQARLAAIADP